MLKIRLCCITGILSTLLVNKIIDAARLRQIEVDIKHIAEVNIKADLEKEDVDVVLIGPHMSYKFKKIKVICDSYNIASGIISMQDYGFMDGDKILTTAISLVKNMKNSAIDEECQTSEEDELNIISSNDLSDNLNNSLTCEESNNSNSSFIETNSNNIPNFDVSSETKKYENEEKYSSNNKILNEITTLKRNDNMINKIKDLLFNAEKEVYINTNMDINLFEEEFNEASQKGVRVTVVACEKYKNHDIPIDKLYTYSNERNKNSSQKFMLVIDNIIALVAEENKTNDDISYTVTDDPLLVSVISKNIHNYIYILKLRDNIDFKLRDN